MMMMMTVALFMNSALAAPKSSNSCVQDVNNALNTYSSCHALTEKVLKKWPKAVVRVFRPTSSSGSKKVNKDGTTYTDSHQYFFKLLASDASSETVAAFEVDSAQSSFVAKDGKSGAEMFGPNFRCKLADTSHPPEGPAIPEQRVKDIKGDGNAPVDPEPAQSDDKASKGVSD